MKTLEARVLDSTHLELSEPLTTARGERVRIVVSEESADTLWHQAVQQSFLDAYADQDQIYHDL